ncbi:hypothetical protein C2G38_2249847 [Gigaspora rosea]|uniref:Uncharacterized protein n=1 Tax=Gigaspora rosea TaxID=44941 RepID=A0A397UXE6_9GLOM|nr:hypothetical protein C2G38_2249847 [Gigaspora rosea]
MQYESVILVYDMKTELAALEDDADLKKNVKRIMKTIVGLLKDRITVEKAPDTKRASTFESYEKAASRILIIKEGEHRHLAFTYNLMPVYDQC